jgi:hypothetical protein
MYRKSLIAACGGLAASTLMLMSPVTASSTATTTATGEEQPTRVVLRDGTGDVWKVNMRTSHWTFVGDLPPADVTRAVVSHRTHAVVVRARYDDLRRIGVQKYWTGIATRRGDYFVEVVSRPGSRAGRHTLYDGPAGSKLACGRLSHDIDYAEDVVRVRVPRSCLDRPRWVRVNIGNLLVTGQKPNRKFYADNPHNHDPYSNFATRRLFRG